MSQWVAVLSSFTFSITYKLGRNDQNADALSRIQWPEVMEMKSQTVKAICEGVQISDSKVEVVSHSVHILTH